MMKIKQEAEERHVLTVIVDNEAGILAKIAGLFTARGYNIDSLTVADITENHQVSRITIVTHGPPNQIDQIHAQLERLVPVHKVIDLTEVGPYVERELALVKVAGTGEARVEMLRLADVFRAKLVGTFPEVRREVRNGVEIRSYGILSVIATLEFVQHHFSKMGHRDLLETHTLSP